MMCLGVWEEVGEWDAWVRGWRGESELEVV